MRGQAPLLALAVAAAIGLSAAAAVWDRFPGDLPLARRIQDIPGGWFEGLMDAGQEIGELEVLLAVGLVALLVVLARGRRWDALLIVFAVAWDAVSPALKTLVQRPRPDPALIAVTVESGGHAYPSGHMLGSTLVFGAIYLLADSIAGGNRLLAHALRVAAVLLLVDVALSRVYLGAHWPSDVLGALLIAGIGLALARGIATRFQGAS